MATCFAKMPGLVLRLVILLLVFETAYADNKYQDQQFSRAIKRAESFLVSHLRKNNDTLTCVTVGASPYCQFHETGNMLVKYFVLNAVSHILSRHDEAVITNQILSQRIGNKWYWGYMKGVVPDADDTAFALQMLMKLQHPVDVVDLDFFYSKEFNSYRTFKTNVKAQPVTFPNSINNHGIHVEINANIFYLLDRLNKQSKINYQYIVDHQLNDGSWEGYFYHGKYYATHMVMKLLCGKDRYLSVVHQGVRFIEKSQHRDGSWGDPYSTALALDTMLECRISNEKSMASALQYLLRTQRQDGSWGHDKPVWEFVEDDVQPSIMFGYDKKRSLTTALVLHALMHYHLK